MVSMNGFLNLSGTLSPSHDVYCFILSSIKNQSPTSPYSSPLFQHLAVALIFTTSSGNNPCLILIHALPLSITFIHVTRPQTYVACRSQIDTGASSLHRYSGCIFPTRLQQKEEEVTIGAKNGTLVPLTLCSAEPQQNVWRQECAKNFPRRPAQNIIHSVPLQ